MEAHMRELLLNAGAVFDSESAADPPAHFGDAAAEYQALTSAAGVADLSRRTQIELRGDDRQSFLHNLSTNDIRRLTPGQGCEAFLCNAQGHTLALVNVFCESDSLQLETVPDAEKSLLAHLDRYLIREKVELRGRSTELGELLLAGPGAEDVLRACGCEPPAALLEHRAVQLGGAAVSVRRVDITQPYGFLVSCPREATADAWSALVARGARPCGAQAVEMARIEAGTPYFGRDITSANLPQEVGRDTRAISFTKGCYIGQETIARLDALGHVNRTLCGVRCAGREIPAAGSEFTGEEGKAAAQVTSAVFSPRLGAPLALAYVRRGMNAPGTQLDSTLGAAEVVKLPL